MAVIEHNVAPLLLVVKSLVIVLKRVRRKSNLSSSIIASLALRLLMTKVFTSRVDEHRVCLRTVAALPELLNI